MEGFKPFEKSTIIALPLLFPSEKKIINNVKRQIILQNQEAKWEDCVFLHSYSCLQVCIYNMFQRFNN